MDISQALKRLKISRQPVRIYLSRIFGVFVLTDIQFTEVVFFTFLLARNCEWSKRVS